MNRSIFSRNPHNSRRLNICPPQVYGNQELTPSMAHLTFLHNLYSKTWMNLPGKMLESSEFISKQKDKGAEADQISPGYPILKESTVVTKEWKQTTWKPHGLVAPGRRKSLYLYTTEVLPKALKINQCLFSRGSQIFPCNHFQRLCFPASTFLSVKMFVFLYWYVLTEYVNVVDICFPIWSLHIFKFLIFRGCRWVKRL